MMCLSALTSRKSISLIGSYPAPVLPALSATFNFTSTLILPEWKLLDSLNIDLLLQMTSRWTGNATVVWKSS